MLMPYVMFNGNCEEALLWYAKIFGGSLLHVSRHENGGVMHGYAELCECGGISSCDTEAPVKRGDGIALQVHLPKQQTAEKIFGELAAGGTIIAPLVSNPPPDDEGISGCVKDQYELCWIVSARKEQ